MKMAFKLGKSCPLSLNCGNPWVGALLCLDTSAVSFRPLNHWKAMAGSGANTRSALFVCLGNICRSPIGERVFRHLVQERGVGDEVTYKDFDKFQYIFAMDDSNLSDLNSIAPASHKAKVELLGTYDPQKKLNVRDPYYDNDMKGFEDVYEHCLRCCTVFLDQLYGK